MENATKGLVTAGAVLVSILMVSVGVNVYNNSGARVADQAAEANEKMWEGVDLSFGEEDGENKTYTQVYYEEGAIFDIANHNISIEVTYTENGTTKTETVTEGFELVEQPIMTLADEVTAQAQDLKVRYKGSEVYTLEDAVVVVDLERAGKAVGKIINGTGYSVVALTEQEFELLNFKTDEGGPTEFGYGGKGILTGGDLIAARNACVRVVTE